MMSSGGKGRGLAGSHISPYSDWGTMAVTENTKGTKMSKSEGEMKQR